MSQLNGTVGLDRPHITVRDATFDGISVTFSADGFSFTATLSDEQSRQLEHMLRIVNGTER
jgi:hypothetical protein